MRTVIIPFAFWLVLAGMALGQTTAPQIWLQPANQTGEAGGNVTFVVAASGSPAPALQWQVSTDGNTWSNVSGTGFSGGTTNMLTLIGATTTQLGNQFRCVATNSVTSTASNTVTLTVLPAGFVNVATIAAGGNFTLFIKSDGSLWTMGLNSSG